MKQFNSETERFTEFGKTLDQINESFSMGFTTYAEKFSQTLDAYADFGMYINEKAYKEYTEKVSDIAADYFDRVFSSY